MTQPINQDFKICGYCGVRFSRGSAEAVYQSGADFCRQICANEYAFKGQDSDVDVSCLGHPVAIEGGFFDEENISHGILMDYFPNFKDYRYSIMYRCPRGDLKWTIRPDPKTFQRHDYTGAPVIDVKKVRETLERLEQSNG